MRLMARPLLSVTLLTALPASFAVAQETYPSVEIGGRLHVQLYWFGNDDYRQDVGPESNIITRRARIEASGEIAENVSFRVQPSFEGGRTSGVRLRDAYIDLRLTPKEARSSVLLRAGQEKRPFSRYELMSSNDLPTIERGAGDGLPGDASNDLFDAAGFLSHDVGASVRLEHELDEGRMVNLTLGVYNGQGESLDDVNDRKSFGARATAAVSGRIDVGASWFAHDGIVVDGATTDSSFTNHAWGVDAQYGKPGDERLFALVEYLQGDDATAAKLRMRGFQAVAAYHVRLDEAVYAIEPFARLDLADPDADTAADRVTTFTAGLGLYLSADAWLRMAYERQSFQAEGAGSVGGIRSMLAVHF